MSLRSTPLGLLALSLLAACDAPAEDPFIDQALGRCTYVNAFNGRDECKEYLGSAWTLEAMQDNCAAAVPGADPGLLELDLGCSAEALLGLCVIDEGTVEANTIYFLDRPGYDCSGLAVGCSFAGGEYRPAAACGGEDPLPPMGDNVFQPFEQVCMDPLEGEPPGLGPDGQVCTWEAISGATEPGRRYEDYASCEPVRSQRPYYAVDRDTGTAPDDPRLTDPAYQTELAWLNEQVEATACVCCHKAELTPSGPSLWWLEQEGIWVDALSDAGLAMMAGWVDSTAFGAFPPSENNGFSRDHTGLPTSNVKRMRRFFLGELDRRGLVQADFVDTPPFGGPLHDQLVYEPGRCQEGVGIEAGGAMSWVGGRARYVYVLEVGSSNPGAPPNLDLPEGTLWRLDVPPDGTPLSSGLGYGQVPAGSVQAWPLEGAPPALQAGRDYVLYVLADVYQPLTRCVFTAE